MKYELLHPKAQLALRFKQTDRIILVESILLYILVT